jgi:hypothetical protein
MVILLSLKVMILSYGWNMNHNLFIDELRVYSKIDDIEIVEEHTYVKLFRMDEMMDEDLVEDMMYSCPHFPDIRIGHIGLLRRR